MAKPRELSNIRKALQGAKRSLNQFERMLPTLQARAIKAVQIEGKRAHLAMAPRHAKEQFADRRGLVRMIGAYGAAWGKRKARLKLDLRRGTARKGVLKQLKSPLGFVKLPDGFAIDLWRPNLTITGRATVGRSLRAINAKSKGMKARDNALNALGVVFQRTNRRSFAVNDYIGRFAKQKAPGLGSLSVADKQAIEAARQKAVADRVATIKGAVAQQHAGKAAAMLILRLDRLA